MSKNFKRFLMMIGFIISTAVVSQAQQVLVANLSGAQEVPERRAYSRQCGSRCNGGGLQNATNI